MVNLINKKSYTPSNRSLGAVCCCVDEFARGIIEALTEMGFDSDTMPVITSFGTSEETLDNLALRLQSMTILMDYVGIAERLVYVVDALIGGMEL